MDIKRVLKDGDVLHCRGNRFLSKIIKWFMKSRITHTALVVELNGLLFVVDSQRDGTQLRLFDEWQRKYKYTFFISRNTCYTGKEGAYYHVDRVFSSIGFKPYDFASLLIHQPRYIITGKWPTRTKEREDNRFYCSEFVSYVLGIPEYYKQSPEDLLQILKSNDCYQLFYPMGNIF